MSEPRPAMPAPERMPEKPPLRERYRRFVSRYGGRLRNRLNVFLARQSRVGNPRVFARGTFAWVDALEANWSVIRDEMAQIMRHGAHVPPLGQISPDHRRLAHDDRWRSFFIWGYGLKMRENARRCPRTTAIVERIPGLLTAMFSIHAPGTHIPRHKGVVKSFVTCHLGLAVPRDGARCRMDVDGETVTWREGEAVVFDDTYHHEVWNDTDEPRIILLLHVKRPLRPLGALLSTLFLSAVRASPFVRDAKSALRHWEDRFKRAEQCSHVSSRP